MPLMFRLFLVTLFLFNFSVQAQRMPTIDSHWSNKTDINGDLSEWGDSLSNYFPEQDLHYSFANDDQYLYIAILVKNKEKQIQAVHNGFKISINTDGKRNNGANLSFPIPDKVALSALSDQSHDKKHDVRKIALKATKAYYVGGFPSILDGPISINNNYGIHAAATIDSADWLSYEAAIRLDQLNMKSFKETLAINIKINGIIRTAYTITEPISRRRGARYPYNNNGYYPQSRSGVQSKEEPGVWQYVHLASNAN